MQWLLLIFFVKIPTGLAIAHFFIKKASPRLNELALFLMICAILCLAMSVFMDSEPPSVEEGWVMYPPLSTEGTPGPAFDWIIAGFVCVGLSVVINLMSFLSPFMRAKTE